MNTGFLVRPGTEAEAKAIACLLDELGYPADTQAVSGRLCRLMSRPDHLVAVAESADGQLCGWLQALSSETLESGFRAEIVGLVTSKTMRRRGIGRLLVEYAESWAARLGATTLVVRTNVKREESHAFYAALGYGRTKTQHVYRKPLRQD